jgi:hypothetical protein
MAKQSRFIPLEKIAHLKKCVTKIVIPSDRFAYLRFELCRCGISSALLFPGLDGICRQIQWLNAISDDEEETGIRVTPQPNKSINRTRN